MRSIAVFIALFGLALEIHAAPPIGETIWLQSTDTNFYVDEVEGELRALESEVDSAILFEVLDADGNGPESNVILKVADTNTYVKLDLSDNILKPNGTVDDIDDTLTHFTWLEVTGGISLTCLGKASEAIVKVAGRSEILRATSGSVGSVETFAWDVVDPVTDPHDASVGLVPFATDLKVELDWDGDTLEAPAQYTVYRSMNEGVTTGDVLATTTESTYTDTSVTNGEIYYYAVSVSDDGSNESELSEVVSAQPIQAAPADSPNIIFFIVDDQNRDEVACYGGQVLTPNLDRLAAEGMRMDEGHAVATVCTPSRYSMFTGRYPGSSTWPAYLESFPMDRHGAPEFNVGLEDDNMNVGNALRLAGYVTGHVGKLHVGAGHEIGISGLPEDPEVIAGWQAHERSTRQWVLERGFSWAKNVYSGNTEDPYNRHNPEWTLEAALEFMELNKDRPFYLHYCTTMMHGGSSNWNSALEYPLYSGAGLLDEAPEPEFRSSIPDLVDAAGFGPETYGFTWMDATVGAMLDKLKELGIDDNTLFVFVTDHGTDGKFSLNDYKGTSIPFIVRWPDVVPAGSVCSNLVQNTDMVPTFFEVAGVTKPAEYRIDGTSIASMLSDPTAKVHDHLYFEMGYGRAVRTDKWKYIAVRHGSDRFAEIEAASLKSMPRQLAYVGNMKRVTGLLSNRPNGYDLDQLYDLENDPMEMNNLAYDPAYAEQLAEMKDILTPYLVAQGRPFGEFVPGPNADADSVPIEQVQPYVDQLKLLQPQDDGKGFEYRYSANGTPYYWMYDSGLVSDDYEALDLLDTDGDGLASWEEFIAGTNPTQSGSGLAVEVDVQPVDGDYVIRWPSVEGRVYRLEESTNLSSGFQVLKSNITATPPENSETVDVRDAAFYRIEVEVE